MRKMQLPDEDLSLNVLKENTMQLPIAIFILLLCLFPASIIASVLWMFRKKKPEEFSNG